MADRKSFLGALWDGDIVGAIGALVAGILHMIVMALFLLLLGLTAPILAVVMPFVAYNLGSESIGILTFFYFFFGAFASGMFTFMVYCRVTQKERRARGETFGQHCRNVAGWPTLSILGSWAADLVYLTMFHEWLWISPVSRFIFFALAPVAVFMPLWVFLIHRRRQRAAMEELSRKFAAQRRQRDAEFLRSQGIVS